MRSTCFVLSALLMTGCATTYQAHGVTGGFSETQLAENVWRVAFRGNGYTPSERVEDLALLRSADLALMNGFAYFALADARSSANVAAITTPITATTTGSAYRAGNTVYGSATTRYSGGNTMFISRPTANNTVMMFKEKPEIGAMVFDAQFICNSLGKKYETSCEAMKPVKGR